MSQWSVSRVGSCLAGVAMGIVCGVGWAEPTGLTYASGDLGIPHDPSGGMLYGPLDEQAPPEFTAFLDATGTPWNVFWDEFLHTPTLAYPHDPFLLPQDPDARPLYEGEHPILKDVRVFIDTHRDFLGVGPEDLAALGVRTFADALHISARQVHQGLPVRGSAFRMLINADRTILSIDNRVARTVPEIDTGRLDVEAVQTRAQEEGIDKILAVTPQVAFPPESDLPIAACVVIGNAPTGEEVEVMYSLTTGERIWGRRTALYQQAPECNDTFELEGVLQGYYPDPYDMCTTAEHIPIDEPYPLMQAQVIVAIPQPCPARFIRLTRDDGSYSLTMVDVPEQPLYPVQIGFENEHFRIVRGHEPYMAYSLEVPNSAGLHVDLNEGLRELASYHLFASHHLRRVTTEAMELVSTYEVTWEQRWSPITVELRSDRYEHKFNPFSGHMVLGNDEIVEVDERGRSLKMVPTIIYHEYGHDFIGRLSGETSDSEAHEGVADAFACYIARSGKLGYASQYDLNADSVARDLAHDRTSYPQDPRRTVAGAFWDLYDATVLPSTPEDGKWGRQSPFAKGLMTRWLAASWVRGPVGVGGRTIESNPRLGHALYLLADHRLLDGDGLLANGFRFDEQLIRAFGRRNLFQFRFIRGDANTDGALDLSDAITILGYLFLGATEIQCADALDSNDSGAIDLSDAVVLLYHLFLGGRDLPRPFPTCSYETTIDDALGCWGGECGFISPAW